MPTHARNTAFLSDLPSAVRSWEQHVRRLRFQQAERLHGYWTDVSFQRLLPVIVSFK